MVKILVNNYRNRYRYRL